MRSGSRRYVPQQGDIVWLTFDPQAGHEQSGRRPAVVLSPGSYNERAGLAICCPITSQIKGYPFEVTVAVGSVKGVALADHLKSVDWQARRARRIGALSQEVTSEILRRAALLLTPARAPRPR